MTVENNDDTWVVTGSNRGIGLAVAEAHLAREGHVLAGFRGAPCDALLDLRDRFGDRLTHVPLDLRAPPDPDLIRQVVSRPIDVIFHNAGIFGPRAPGFRDLDHAAVLEAFDVNVLGMIRVTEAFLPYMEGAPRPRIVAVSSLMGTIAKAAPDSFAYRTSKAAMNMALHLMAAELTSSGIALACLRPGHVRTDMGGPHGSLSPAESAAAMLPIVDRLQPADRPPFLDIDGQALPW